MSVFKVLTYLNLKKINRQDAEFKDMQILVNKFMKSCSFLHF